MLIFGIYFVFGLKATTFTVSLKNIAKFLIFPLVLGGNVRWGNGDFFFFKIIIIIIIIWLNVFCNKLWKFFGWIFFFSNQNLRSSTLFYTKYIYFV